MNEETVLHFELTVNESNVVLAALQELPHKVADPLIRKLIGQANEQTAPVAGDKEEG